MAIGEGGGKNLPRINDIKYFPAAINEPQMMVICCSGPPLDPPAGSPTFDWSKTIAFVEARAVTKANIEVLSLDLAEVTKELDESTLQCSVPDDLSSKPGARRHAIVVGVKHYRGTSPANKGAAVGVAEALKNAWATASEFTSVPAGAAAKDARPVFRSSLTGDSHFLILSQLTEEAHKVVPEAPTPSISPVSYKKAPDAVPVSPTRCDDGDADVSAPATIPVVQRTVSPPVPECSLKDVVKRELDKREDPEVFEKILSWLREDPIEQDLGEKHVTKRRKGDDGTVLPEAAEPLPLPWMPVMPEKLQVYSEYAGVCVLPALGLMFDYSFYGCMLSFFIVFCHTIGAMLSNFGPESSHLRLKNAPFSAMFHVIVIDSICAGSHIVAIFVWPHLFGPTPYKAAFFILCTLVLDTAMGYNTVCAHGHPGPSNSAQTKRNLTLETKVLVSSEEKKIK